MSSFVQCEKEGHPVFSYDKDSNKQFWMITAPPDCDLSQLSSVKIDFEILGKFKIGEKKYCIKENKQVNSNQFLTLLPKKKSLKIAKQFVRNLIITEEFTFDNEIPLNTYFPKEIVPPPQRKGLKIQIRPSGYVAPPKKRSIFIEFDFNRNQIGKILHCPAQVYEGFFMVIPLYREYSMEDDWNSLMSCMHLMVSRNNNKAPLELWYVLTEAEKQYVLHSTEEGADPNHFLEDIEKLPYLPYFNKEWYFLGPYPIGKGEYDSDPANLPRDYSHLFPAFEYVYPSELSPNGTVKWNRVFPNEDGKGYIHIEPEVNWNTLIQSLSSVEILEFQGWLYTEIFVPKNITVLMSCDGVNTFYINNNSYVGNIYQNNIVKNRVEFTEGIYSLRLHIKAKQSADVRCKIEEISIHNRFAVQKNVIIPDTIDNTLLGEYIGITITNNHHNPAVIIPTLIPVDKSIQENITLQPLFPNISPGQTTLLPLKIPDADTRTLPTLKYTLEIEMKYNPLKQYIPIEFRRRYRAQSVVITFLDHDNTVTNAGVIFPLEAQKEKKPMPILVSLHGTGVEPSNQADSYKYMIKNMPPYIFGVSHFYVLTPNRFGAHNWEYTGHWTVMRAIEVLNEMTKNLLHSKFGLPEADMQHILYTGHSMGGHGAWVLGTLKPDRCIALIPLSGWIRKEEYGDSNTFFKFDAMTSFTEPYLKYILESSVSEYNTDLFISNLRGIQVHTRTGSDDRTVPPFYTIKMNRILRENNIKYTTEIVQGKEHWWWDSIRSNDGGVVNDEKMRQLYKKIFYNNFKKPRGDLPKRFQLTVINPANHEGKFGIRVLQLIKPSILGKIIVSPTKTQWKIRTINIQMFRINPVFMKMVNNTLPSVIVDGMKFNNGIYTSYVVKQCTKSTKQQQQSCNWKLEKIPNYNIFKTVLPAVSDILPYPRRSPSTYGPMRQIYQKPFLVIIGSNCTKEYYNRLKEFALFFINTHYVATNTFIPLFSDLDEIPIDMLLYYNIVLIGKPVVNRYTKIMFDLLNEQTQYPFILKDNGDIQFQRCRYNNGNGLSAVMMFPIPPDFLKNENLNLKYDEATMPNQNNRLGLYIYADDHVGFNNLVRLATPTIPPMVRSPFTNYLPDYVVLDSKFRSYGVGSFLATGYFGNDWEFRDDVSYTRC